MSKTCPLGAERNKRFPGSYFWEEREDEIGVVPGNDFN
jgi:hypothetical protein